MEAIAGIKVFAMNDSDWYAAATEQEALKCMAETWLYDTVEECVADLCGDGPIVELSDGDLDTLMFSDEGDGKDPSTLRRLTFRQLLQEMVDGGEKFPTFFASTEY